MKDCKKEFGKFLIRSGKYQSKITDFRKKTKNILNNSDDYESTDFFWEYGQAIKNFKALNNEFIEVTVGCANLELKCVFDIIRHNNKFIQSREIEYNLSNPFNTQEVMRENLNKYEAALKDEKIHDEILIKCLGQNYDGVIHEELLS